MKKNTIIIHACGGAGCAIGTKVIDALTEQYSTYSDMPAWEIEYIDSTEQNIISVLGRDPSTMDNFTKITSNLHSKKDIDGSGGDRGTNYKDIAIAASAYLDDNAWIKNNVNEFHIVISSAGGGTGSVISPLLVNSLLERNITVIPILIGDSSTMNYARNTLNALSTFNNIANKLKKPIALIYGDNDSSDTVDCTDTVNNVNAVILAQITVLSVFLSGTNTNIDNQDMHNFIDFTKNRLMSSEIPVGVYGLDITTSGSSERLKNVISERVLIYGNESVEKLAELDSIIGTVSSNNPIDGFTEVSPLRVSLTSGTITELFNDANVKFKKLQGIASKVTAENIPSGESDDTGMVI